MDLGQGMNERGAELTSAESRRGRMRTTTELTIRGERIHLERLLARVEALLSDGWKRDREAEERLGRRGALGPWTCCFSCTAKVDRPGAGCGFTPAAPMNFTSPTWSPWRSRNSAKRSTTAVRRGSPGTRRVAAVCWTAGLPPGLGTGDLRSAQWQGRETLPQLGPWLRGFREVISGPFLTRPACRN